MKAAQIYSYDDRSGLQISKNVEKPSIVPAQVLVEVHAAGVNPFDTKVLDGVIPALKLPATLGGDVSGVIVEVGSEVVGLEVGQEVYGQAGALGGKGSFAEYTPVKAASLAAKPKSVDFLTAAALPLVASSAHQALVEHMNLQPGQKILIHGGAGGIGSVAIQMAKHLGAEVTTTAQSGETDFVKSLGADQVIDYTTQDFSEILTDLDAVFDTVGGETNTKSYKVLKNGGSLVSMLVAPNESLVAEKDVNYTQQMTKVTTENLNRISEMVDAGSLKINIDKVFPLDQAAEALEYLKTGHPRGKVVIQVK